MMLAFRKWNANYIHRWMRVACCAADVAALKFSVGLRRIPSMRQKEVAWMGTGDFSGYGS
jgi:hypothetical protein